MNDFISREAVWEMLEKAHIISNGEYSRYCAEDIFIDNIPAADVQPVKRARWIIRKCRMLPYCSACGSEPVAAIMTKYCPNCGALMQYE